MTIIQAIHDPHLFRPLLKSLDTWRAWLVVLRAVFGLPMTEADRGLFVSLTGRETPPEKPIEECWLVVGRRGGKSFIVALIAVFLATFRDYRPFLGPGERGVLMIIATGTDEPAFVFVTKEGTRLDASNVRHTMNRVLNKAGLPHFSPHCFRHSYASLMLQQRESLKYVQNHQRFVRRLVAHGE